MLMGENQRFMNIIREKTTLLLFILTLAVIFAFRNICLAEETKSIREFPIPGYGILLLNLPTSWHDEIYQPREDQPPSIILRPKSGDEFYCWITILWPKKEEPGFNHPERIKVFVKQEGETLLDRAVETQILLQELQGSHSIGYFFTLTDKSPKRGEFRYMTRGAIGVGTLLLAFTHLYHKKDSPSLKEMLVMLQEVRQRKKQ